MQVRPPVFSLKDRLKAAEIELVRLRAFEEHCKRNNLGGYEDGIYAGTRLDWIDRAFSAENKLEITTEALSSIGLGGIDVEKAMSIANKTLNRLYLRAPKT